MTTVIDNSDKLTIDPYRSPLFADLDKYMDATNESYHSYREFIAALFLSTDGASEWKVIEQQGTVIIINIDTAHIDGGFIIERNNVKYGFVFRDSKGNIDHELLFGSSFQFQASKFPIARLYNIIALVNYNKSLVYKN